VVVDRAVSVAAKIPCAPSTLSVRLKKAMAKEANGQVVGHTNGRGEAGHTAAEPLQILRSALLATKTNGEPHWPTRLAAVRMLATLRPEEFESTEQEQPTEPSIVVFDLEPGALPVLHRPLRKDQPAVTTEDAPQAVPETSAAIHSFTYLTAEGEWVPVGTWSPPQPDDAIIVTGAFHVTHDVEEADRWRSELSAGILPTGIEDAS
jgi:hypothetical protein